MNDENLKKGKDTQFRSGEEAARNGRRGGIASGESKRENKTLQAWAQILGQLPLETLKNKKKMEEIADLMKASGIKDPTWKAGLVASMYIEGMDGNVQAFRSLGDLDGEFKQNVSLDIVTPEDEERALMETFGKCKRK